jgi:hypothetical protein
MPPLALRTLLLFAYACAIPAQAQPPRQAGQFYVSSDGEYAWSVDAGKKLRSTTWFARHPLDAPHYRQLTAVIYDTDPNKVYYVDKAGKRLVGRLDLSTEKFSLLHAETQRVRQAFNTVKFPSDGELPSVAQMFEPLPEGQRGNTSSLALPPPTLQFPQLEHSTWDTSYLSADKFLIRSVLTLNGDRGTYRLTQKPGTGRLANVKYERDGEEHVIRGNWSLGRSKGTFKFNVPAHNLNVFWGEFSFEQGRTVGAWDGVRKIRPPNSQPDALTRSSIERNPLANDE